MYNADYTALTLNGQGITQTQRNNPVSETTQWETRLGKRINALRADIGILTQSLRPNSS